MIAEIIHNINTRPELAARLQMLVDDSFDELELSTKVKEYFFRQFNEEVGVRPVFGREPDTELERQVCDLFDTILNHAIQSITTKGWLTIAQHLWTKYWTQRTTDQIGFPHYRRCRQESDLRHLR
jgi:hypothetical protein